MDNSNHSQRESEQVRNILQDEVPIPGWGTNVVDFGLVFEIEIASTKITVDLLLISPKSTLTTKIGSSVEQTLNQHYDRKIEVRFLQEPAWSPEKMTSAGKHSFNNFQPPGNNLN